MSSLLKLNTKDIVGAIVSGVIVAILGYVSQLTSIYEISWDQIINIAVLSAITSLLKSLGTDTNGKLLGKIQIK